ncbi:DMT family transporter [Fervidibacillus halotolerans]|uniref:DMT family transporter n=1 Tax=Fervidibacillus halotolerans TaxID=2980027 RepID=A0A9E8LY23_9BACI|nr:EamA family transporter [Fervidibacillus halotolerans]WAA11802.1 DMT family transporter [Fervidibacillus halotolerans]
MNPPKINPYILVIVGVLSVSTSAIFVKLLSVPSGVIAFYRLFFSVLIILPFYLAKHLPETKKITRRDLFFSSIAGLFLAFHFILWFESLNYTSVASSTVLVTLQPLFSFVGTYIFYKEPLTPLTVLSGLIAIFGSVIISWGDFTVSNEALYGDFLALVACGLITGYLLFGQTVRKRVSLVTYTFIVYSISSFVLFLYVLFNRFPLFSYNGEQWLYFLLLAIIPTLLGHSLFNWAIKWISTNVVSMMILLEPIGATILAYFILGEKVLLSQWVGGMIVLFGLGLFSYRGYKSEKNKGINDNRETL